MKSIRIKILISAETITEPIEIDGKMLRMSKYTVSGTGREMARSVTQNTLDCNEDDELIYTDYYGFITNRIGRLVRDKNIDINKVSIYIVDNNRIYHTKFKENGQIKNFPYGQFDVEEDIDLIKKIQ